MNESMSRCVVNTWTMLKITYGLVGIIAGADKFFNLITTWEKYINPAILHNVPLSPLHFMWAVGIIEIVAGLLILSPYTKIGAYLMAAWLVLIALNLVSMGMYYDIAVRDVVIAVGAIALACLTDVTCCLPSRSKSSNARY